MKTYQPKAKEIKRNWHLVDAKDKVLGRLSTEIVKMLMGKNKVDYVPHLDQGDYVVVTNAGKVLLTGRKIEQKVYYSHSGYPGGFKKVAVKKLLNERPEKIIEKAVFGMLPDNRLKRKRMARLKVFSGGDNPYADKFANVEKKE